MKIVGLLVLVLLFHTAPAWAQTTYNRWNALPVPEAKPTASASERGAKILSAKAKQDLIRAQKDSIRLSTPSKDLMQRGIGQREKLGKLLSNDARYYEHTRRVPYPSEALRAQTEGKVTVRILIDAMGQVIDSQLIETTIPADAPGRDLMIRQFSQVLRGLRFEPSNGTTQEDLSINFKIH